MTIKREISRSRIAIFFVHLYRISVFLSLCFNHPNIRGHWSDKKPLFEQSEFYWLVFSWVLVFLVHLRVSIPDPGFVLTCPTLKIGLENSKQTNHRKEVEIVDFSSDTEAQNLDSAGLDLSGSEALPPGLIQLALSADDEPIDIPTIGRPNVKIHPKKKKKKAPAIIKPSIPHDGALGVRHDGKVTQFGIPLRFCVICDIYQPLRTKHCYDCNVCVLTHDHHCPWIGTCVAAKNRGFFLLYLIAEFFELLGAIYLSYVAFTYQIDELQAVSKASFGRQRLPKEIPLSSQQIFVFLSLVFSIVSLVPLFLMVIILGCFHIKLASTNMTTWETASWDRITYLEGLPDGASSPFSFGCFGNCLVFFLGSDNPIFRAFAGRKRQSSTGVCTSREFEIPVRHPEGYELWRRSTGVA
eukprot:GHVP01005608.1.p1 GENE.GHVP01005608.1~~GHVP01005608.1.p1  ORF type:complete len:421 (+),score=52.10 GHVP01005608.1:31-1263(+)